MEYQLYHAKNPTFGMGNRPKFPDEYEMVAVVEASSLEDIFRLTNHIESDWTGNAEILEVIATYPRSTSVGDIVVDENEMIYYCDNVGWKHITGE